MTLKNKNRKEDLKLLLSFGSGYDGRQFKIVFHSGRSGANVYVCAFDGATEYTHCVMADETNVLCLLKNHNLPCGRLEAELWIWEPDTQMPDGKLRLVSNDVVTCYDENGNEFGVVLTEGKSDSISISAAQVTLLSTILKGDPFTYEDFTAEQLAALKGDAFTYEDFTEEQIEELKKPATDAAAELTPLIAQAEEDHTKVDAKLNELAPKITEAEKAASAANKAAEAANNVNATLNGTTITVTSSDGTTKSTDIKGDKGDDYVLTKADKTEIAAIVSANFIDLSTNAQ